MAQGIKPADGQYRCTDHTGMNESFTVSVNSEGVGCIYGSFEEVPYPGGGVMYKLDLYTPTVYLIFRADGTFSLIKPGPDAGGTYAQI